MGAMEYLVIAFFFGLGTGVIGKGKGSSFFIWFLIGMVLPPLGLIAVMNRTPLSDPELCQRLQAVLVEQLSQANGQETVPVRISI